MPSILLRNATLIELAPPKIEKADLRIREGKIIKRGKSLRKKPGEEVVDLREKFLLPGMVCAHTHLYSALACGMPPPTRTPKNFLEILQRIWWRLDWAHNEKTIYYSALVGALEAALSGTTLLIDHHASPSFIRGSLRIIKRALEDVGLRAVLCYEVTDRGGMKERDDGLEENVDFISAHKRHPFFRGLFGAHASFTLGNESLRACVRLAHELHSGLHIHAGESFIDLEDARKKYSRSPIERLQELGGLGPKTLLAHGTHLSQADVRRARQARAWLVHNPRSNMNNAVGYALPVRFGARVALGTDGISSDMFEELKFAYFKWRDSQSEAQSGTNAAPKRLRPALKFDSFSLLSNNHVLASEIFGSPFGRLDRGSTADLLVLDYVPATPLTNENLSGHLLFGIGPRNVESVIVAGRFVVKERRIPHLDVRKVRQKAAALAQQLWHRAF